MAHSLKAKTPFSRTIKNKCFLFIYIYIYIFFFFRFLSPNSSSPFSHPLALLLFLIVQLFLSPKSNIQVISKSKTKSSTVPKRNMMYKKRSITQINMVPFWVKALVVGSCLKGRIVEKSRSHTNWATSSST